MRGFLLGGSLALVLVGALLSRLPSSQLTGQAGVYDIHPGDPRYCGATYCVRDNGNGQITPINNSHSRYEVGDAFPSLLPGTVVGGPYANVASGMMDALTNALYDCTRPPDTVDPACLSGTGTSSSAGSSSAAGPCAACNQACAGGPSQRCSDCTAACGPGSSCIAVSNFVDESCPQTLQPDTSFFIECSGRTGNTWPNLCSPHYATAVTLTAPGTLGLTYTVPSDGHCTSVRVYAFVNGVLKGGSNYLGFTVTPPTARSERPMSASIDLGSYPAGTYTISLQAEGDGIYCSNGYTGISAWQGDVAIVMNPDQCPASSSSSSTSSSSSSRLSSSSSGAASSAVVHSAASASVSSSRSSSSSVPAPVCGNGARESGEQCDDGNRTKNDGCSDLCITEPGWRCTVPVSSSSVASTVSSQGSARSTASSVKSSAASSSTGSVPVVGPTVTVQVQNCGFIIPSQNFINSTTMYVTAGTTVQFQTLGGTSSNTLFLNGQSHLLSSGQSFSNTFSTVGTADVSCQNAQVQGFQNLHVLIQ